MAVRTENESLRLLILQEINNELDQLKTSINTIQIDIEECKENPDRWPPWVHLKLAELDKLLNRYRNVVDLRRMPMDRGDAAIRRALNKLGWTHYAGSGNGEHETLIRGYQQMIDLDYTDAGLSNFVVTYHGDHYGDHLWSLTNPTAGAVLDKLRLELPFE